MISLVLTSTNSKEAQIIVSAFDQYGFNIKSFDLDYKNYLRCLQFCPDFIIVEVPYDCEKQIQFVKLLKVHPNNRDLKIIGYGPADIKQKVFYFNEKLFTKYFPKPLRFSSLLSYIKAVLPVKYDDMKPSKNALTDETDLSTIRSDEILPSMKLKMLLQHSTSFLAFPFSVTRVLSITSDPKTGAAELAKTIQTDPVISPYVLRTANTVFFAAHGRRITSVQDAIVRIGFNETRRIVLCIGVMDIFEDKIRNFGFNRKMFWLHSIAVAVATEFFFSMGKYKELREYAFLTGLLHDFGTIVMDEFIPEIFSETLEKTVTTGGEFSSIFHTSVGLHPQKISAGFFKHWKLHDLIESGCQFKSGDINALEPTSAENYLTLSIYLAHSVVKSLGVGHSCDQFISAVPSDVMRKMNLLSGVTDGMVDRLYHNILELCRFLHLRDIRTHHPFSSPKISTNNSEIVYYSVATELFSPHLLYMKTLGQPVKQILNLNKLTQYAECPPILVLSLDDTSKETAEEFLENHYLINSLAKYILILTDHEEHIQQCLGDEKWTVLPKSIDARLLGRRIKVLLLSLETEE